MFILKVRYSRNSWHIEYEQSTHRGLNKVFGSKFQRISREKGQSGKRSKHREYGSKDSNKDEDNVCWAWNLYIRSIVKDDAKMVKSSKAFLQPFG